MSLREEADVEHELSMVDGFEGPLLRDDGVVHLQVLGLVALVRFEDPGPVQVWPLTQFFLFPFCIKSLICLEGKSMTPRRGNTIMCSSSQQLPFSVEDP